MLENNNLLEMTVDIVGAMVSNNDVPAERLPSLINSVHAALAGLGKEPVGQADAEKPEPAVTARKSLADPNTIISMIDGKAYSSLKRHITKHGYTPGSYRDAFGLKADYPMIAPGYSERRREIAKTIGLGRKASVAPVEGVPAKRPRKPRVKKTEKTTASE